MAGGWTRDGAVQDQIDDTVAAAVLAARASIPSGDSDHTARSAAMAVPKAAAAQSPACEPV